MGETIMNIAYLFLMTPLHTGGSSQEGNVVGIARESHTMLPYIPSSSIRGRLRAATVNHPILSEQTEILWGNTLATVGQASEIDGALGSDNLTQGTVWIGDGSILWLPVPSLSHGVVWVSCPMLIRRWLRFQNRDLEVPEPYSTNLIETGAALRSVF